MVEAGISEPTTKLACRINRQVALPHDDFPYLVNLEILQENGNWIPIVSYEITYYQSFKIESIPHEPRKVTAINLPFETACQLSENDLKRNWREYVQRFLR
jgi:hypothetical protein